MFDEQAADKVVNFIELFCKHSKGKFARQNLKLLGWQRDLLRKLFGTKDANNKRQYRQCGIWVPRRNGKTTLMAAVALFMLLADHERGPEVYLVANTVEQAGLLWSVADAMIKQCSAFSSRLKVYKATRKIVDEKNFGKLSILSSENSANLGQNASCLIFDELAQFADRRLYTNLRGSQLNREQPLILTISTASDNLSGIGKEQYDYGCSVRDGKIEDPSFLPVIYEAPPELDWKDPATWRLANPSLGEAFGEQELAQLAREAVNEPRKQAEFEQFHLNRWIGNAVAWLNQPAWLDCHDSFPDLTGRTAYLGADLARTGDLASYCLLFAIDDKVYLLPRFFTPKVGVEDKELRDKAPYRYWARQGFLTLCEGNVIADAEIRQAIKEDALKYKITQIGFDPLYGESLFNQQLRLDDGFEVVQVRQGMVTMGPPTAAFERMVKSKKIVHNNHPILNWNVENASVVSDRNDNIMVAKMHNNTRRKVDGLQAAIVGLSLLLKQQDDSPQVLVW